MMSTKILLVALAVAAIAITVTYMENAQQKSFDHAGSVDPSSKDDQRGVYSSTGEEVFESQQGRSSVDVPADPATLDAQAATQETGHGLERRMALAQNLRDLFLRMTSVQPPPISEVETMVSALAGEMRVDPKTISGGLEGAARTAVFVLPGTDIRADLSIAGPDASLRFMLPSNGEKELFFAGSFRLSIKLEGGIAVSGSTGFQHYPNTGKPSRLFWPEGKTGVCGWNYGATSITPIGMRAMEDGVGWEVGRLGGADSIDLPGHPNLAPYDSWARLLESEIPE